MSRLKYKKHKRNALLALPFIIFTLLLSAYITYSAFTDTTNNGTNTFETGDISITDDDENTVMFELQNLTSNQNFTRCINVSNNGTLDFNGVDLYTTNLQGDGLESWLELEITRGQNAVGGTGLVTAQNEPDTAPFDNEDTSCNGFNDTEGNIYSDVLGNFPDEANSIQDLNNNNDWEVNDTKSYRFTVNVPELPNSLEGKNASLTFTWKAYAGAGDTNNNLPYNNAPPQIQGDNYLGQTLSLEPGVWGGPGPITYGYNWYSCDDQGNNCVEVSNPSTGSASSLNEGASSLNEGPVDNSTYIITENDIGKRIKGKITAANAHGSQERYTALTPVITGTPTSPTNNNLPIITGNLLEGQTLSTTTGSWSGTGPITYTYQWIKCDVDGLNCNDLSGSVSSTYFIPTNNHNSRYKVEVTATNNVGNQTVESVLTAPVDATLYNLTIPSLTGTPAEDQTIVTNSGSWFGALPITFSYQWQACDNNDTNYSDCVNITNDSSANISYRILNAQVGKYLRSKLTADNAAAGNVIIYSNLSSIVEESAPVNYTIPTITGTVADGQTLTGNIGEWRGSPIITYAYQWQQCNNSGNICNDINNATSSTYTITNNDVNFKLRLGITATNNVGSATEYSDLTSNVSQSPPTSLTAPIISGNLQDNEILTVSNGTWAGSTPLTYSYQWQRCNELGEDCANINLATTNEYTLTNTDISQTIRARVTATNSSGNAQAFSAITSVIGALEVSNNTAPSVLGTPAIGTQLTVNNGSWAGSLPITYSYQWIVCDNAGNNCIDITGATNNTYTPTSNELDKKLKVAVTADNAANNPITITTVLTNIVKVASPINNTLPIISGDATVNEVLTVNNGSWTSDTPITYTYQWQRYDGNTYTNISGATNNTYTLANTDAGKQIRVQIAASNGAYSPTTVYTSLTNLITALPPINNVAPIVSGTTEDTRTLTVSNGSWSGTTPITYSYQWQRYDGNTYTNISGATTNSYTLTSSDVNNQIRAIVTASNLADDISANSNLTNTITYRSPNNTTLPVISGTYNDGETLTTNTGSWTGSTPITYSYQWQRYDGNTYTNISGATTNSYTLTSSDVNNQIRVQVTANNASNNASTVNSNLTPNIEVELLENTALPTISGTLTDGQTLTVANGSWTGGGTISYSYQWQRYDGSTYTNITDATNNTYTLTSSDVNNTIRARVTASNSAGDLNAFSELTNNINGVAPTNSVAPVLSGNINEGDNLTVTNGSWNGTTPITYSYAWQRCDSSGDNCDVISGVTNNSYTLTSNDLNSKIKAQVTATNSAGSSSQYSNLSNNIGSSAPQNTGLPAISGNLEDGATITGSNGTWSGTAPITYAYQWQRCDSAGNNCTDISGATNNSYTLASSDVGNKIKFKVIATNSVNSTEAVSSASNIIEATAPENQSLPVVTGNLADSQTLSATDGVWTGAEPITYTYQWQRCDSAGNNCSNISGATNNTYVLTSNDVGNRIRIRVTADNSASGTVNATSLVTTVITAIPVSNVSLPIISGTFEYGNILSTSNGTWNGSTPITYAYQWQRCDNTGNNCSNISGATSSTYPLVLADLNNTLKVVVTADNSVNNAETAISATTPIIVSGPPANNVIPEIDGQTQVGKTLTSDKGTWTSVDSITYAYQWQRCDSEGDNCNDISGATSDEYILVNDDLGNKVKLIVTATNSQGNTSASSQASLLVINTPTNIYDDIVLSDSPYGYYKLDDSTTNTALDSSGNNRNLTRTGTITDNSVPGAIPGSHAMDFSNGGFVSSTAFTGQAGSLSDNYTIEAWVKPSSLNQSGQGDGLSYNGTFGNVIAGQGTYASGGNNYFTGAYASISGQKAVNYSHDANNDDIKAKLLPSNNSFNNTTNWKHVIAKRDNGINSLWINGQKVAESSDRHTPNLNVASLGRFTIAYMANWTNYFQGTLDNVAWYNKPLNDVSIVNHYQAASVLPNASVNTVLPIINGTLKETEQLTATKGSWSGNPIPLDFNYQWQRCDSNGNNCTDILSETSLNYTVASEDVGNRLRLEVKANNGVETIAYSQASNIITTSQPVNLTTPTISGQPYVDQILSSTNGTWRGTQPITYEYQWLRCDSNGANCVNIDGATNSTYTINIDDTNMTVRLKVAATNVAGITEETSNQTALISNLRSYNEEVLADSPYAYYPLDETSTTDANDFSGNDRNLTGTSDTVQETGATPGSKARGFSNNHLLSTGNFLGQDNNANTNYTLSLWVKPDTLSQSNGFIAGSGQYAAAAPGIGGAWLRIINNKANALTAYYYPNYSYWTASASGTTFPNTTNWQHIVLRSNNNTVTLFVNGTSVATFADNTGFPVNLGRFNIGQVLNGGSSNPFDGLIDNVAWYNKPLSNNRILQHYLSKDSVPQPPTNNVLPTITGTLTDGQTITANNGSWTGYPSSYNYQWERCDNNGNNCQDISGATNQTYTLTSTDVNNKLRVNVTADNGNTANAQSSVTDTINPLAVSNNALPEISGGITVGETVTTTNGSWTGTPTIVYSYQWQRCDEAGNNCADIAGATNQSYTITNDDTGQSLKIKVTADNAANNEVTVISAIYSLDVYKNAVLSDNPNAYYRLDETNGTTATNLGTTSSINGTYTNSPLLDQNGILSFNKAVSFDGTNDYISVPSNIALRPSSNYTIGFWMNKSQSVSDSEVIYRSGSPGMYVAINSSNNIYTGRYYDGSNSIVATSSKNIVDSQWHYISTTFDGTNIKLYIDGILDSTSSNNSSPTNYANNTVNIGSNILNGNLTGNYYNGLLDEFEYYNGTVFNVAEICDRYKLINLSAGSNCERPAPVNTVLPVVSGTTADNSILTTTTGTWTSSENINYTYQWQRCDSAGENCVDISGATNSTYTLNSNDVNSKIRSKITATNATGGGLSNIEYSAVTNIINAVAPTNTVAPVASGTKAIGEILSVTNGSWTGTPTITYTYQWIRCDDVNGTNCVDIAGATNNTYTVTSSDDSKSLKARITATNSAGSNNFDSNYLGGLTYNQAINNSNPIQYYKLDETSGDALSSTVSPLSLTSYPGSVTWGVSGAVPGTAVNMNTQLLYNASAVPPALPTTANSKYTVETWIKWNGDTVGPYSIFSTDAYQLLIYNNAVGFNTANSEVYGTNAVTAFPNANTWYHIVAVFNNGSVTANKLYINGVAKSLSYVVGSSSINRSFGSDPYFFLGGYRGSAGSNGEQRWPGHMDNTSLYNRELTSTEVTTHYDARNG